MYINDVGQWAEIISAVAQVGTKAYEAKVQKDVAKKQEKAAQTQALLEQRAQQAAFAAQQARAQGFLEKYGVILAVGAGIIVIPVSLMLFMKKKQEPKKA